MSEFKDRLKAWRGKRYAKEAAGILGVPVPTFRKWENGKRTPKQLTMIEVERRMSGTA